MKYRQEFRVPERVGTVWLFFEQPLRVAECIPGFEKAVLLEGDSLSVRATQKLGPMSATFEARVRITERVHEERIEFTSTGKAVRGAVGNFRARNSVFLKPAGDETEVLVEGEAALAGVLGTIGHTVITKQAKKATAEFARNLERALSGAEGPAAAASAPVRPQAAPMEVERTTASTPVAQEAPARPPSDPWAKAAAVLSGAATIVGLIILWQLSV